MKGTLCKSQRTPLASKYGSHGLDPYVPLLYGEIDVKSFDESKRRSQEP